MHTISKNVRAIQLSGFLLSWLLLGVVASPPWAVAASTVSQDVPRKESKGNIHTVVKAFDNQRKPLIPTLYQIVTDFQLPLGIESFDREGLEEPVNVKGANTTIEGLLDICVKQTRGYAWAVRDGVINVYSTTPSQKPPDFLNLILPSFEVMNKSVAEASANLQMHVALQMLCSNHQGPCGAVSTSLSTPDSHETRLTFKMQNATVRQILNRLVATQGNATWIALLRDKVSLTGSGDGLQLLITVNANEPLPIQILKQSLQKLPLSQNQKTPLNKNK